MSKLTACTVKLSRTPCILSVYRLETTRVPAAQHCVRNLTVGAALGEAATAGADDSAHPLNGISFVRLHLPLDLQRVHASR
jgi:hypothetical protein